MQRGFPLLLLFVAAFLVVNCQSWGTFWQSASGGVSPEIVQSWIRSLTTAGGISTFNAVATDPEGNVYAAGSTEGAGPFTFGTGVETNPTGTGGGWKNGLLVKYDKNGVALWARSVNHSAQSLSDFFGVAVDGSGNVLIAGRTYSTTTFDFGNSVSFTGVGGSIEHFLVAKYNSSGTAQWAKSNTNAAGNAKFLSVAADSAGNVYAAGRIQDNAMFDFGSGVQMNAAANTFNGFNLAAIKYDTNGNPIWAITTVNTTTNGSSAAGVVVDTAGNPIVCGYISGSGGVTLPASAAIAGAGTGNNALIVKLDASNGNTLAYFSTSASGGGGVLSEFTSCTRDSAGNIYASGFQQTVNTMSYGLGNIGGGATGRNALLVKYAPNLGAPQWARLSSNTFATEYNAVATDTGGNVYAAGSITGNLAATFNGATAHASSGFAGGKNAALIKFDANGNGLASRVLKSGAGASQFWGIKVSSLNAIVAAGDQANSGAYTYDDNLTIAGPFVTGVNLVVMQFKQ